MCCYIPAEAASVDVEAILRTLWFNQIDGRRICYKVVSA